MMLSLLFGAAEPVLTLTACVRPAPTWSLPHLSTGVVIASVSQQSACSIMGSSTSHYSIVVRALSALHWGTSTSFRVSFLLAATTTSAVKLALVVLAA